MPDAFKNLINAARVREAGEHLAKAWPDFNLAAFEKQALHQLDTLELKARAMQVADALEATLPEDFHQAAQVIESALGGLPLVGTPECLAAIESMRAAGFASRTCTIVTAAGVMWQTIIHTIFILSAIGIAMTDRLMGQTAKPGKVGH